MNKPKDRSGKLKAFKQKATSKNKPKKIEMENQKQIVRKATWQSDERFSISGDEFQALSNFANIMAPLVEMSNRILGQAELDGKLGFDYSYTDNTPLEAEVKEKYESERMEKLEKRREEIEKYMKALRDQSEKLNAEMAKIKPETDLTSSPPETQPS